MPCWGEPRTGVDTGGFLWREEGGSPRSGVESRKPCRAVQCRHRALETGRGVQQAQGLTGAGGVRVEEELGRALGETFDRVFTASGFQAGVGSGNKYVTRYHRS